MSISKRNSWKPGEFAFFVKIIYPDGAVIEIECEHVDKGRGTKFVEAMNPHLFGKPYKKAELP